MNCHNKTCYFEATTEEPLYLFNNEFHCIWDRPAIKDLYTIWVLLSDSLLTLFRKGKYEYNEFATLAFYLNSWGNSSNMSYVQKENLENQIALQFEARYAPLIFISNKVTLEKIFKKRSVGDVYGNQSKINLACVPILEHKAMMAFLIKNATRVFHLVVHRGFS